MPTEQEQAYADQFLTAEQPIPQASWMSGAGASFVESFEAGPLSSIGRSLELSAAEHGVGKYGRWTGPTPRPEPSKPVPSDYAREIAADAGVKVDFGDADIPEAAVKIMINRAVEKQRRQEVIASSGIGMGTQLGAGFAAGLADPLNLLAAFVPVAPEALVARIAAAETFTARTAARAAVGAVEGAAGAAIVEVPSQLAAYQEGSADYGVVRFLQNVAFGAGFGATVRPVAGGIGDIWQSRLNALTEHPEPPTWADVVPRLDQETQHTALMKAADDLINDNPVSASEVINQAAAADPEFARTIKVSAALKRDGPDFDDTVGRQEWWIARLKFAADRKVRKGEQLADVEHTREMMRQAGVKPKTTNAIKARKLVEYERSVIGAERVHAELSSEQSFLDEMIGGIDEAKLSHDERVALAQDRAVIQADLAKETADIDTYMNCLLGGE